MGNWRITSKDKGNPGWNVTLADCDQPHAETVLRQLEQDSTVPSNLVLKEIEEDALLKPGGKPSLMRRILGG